MAGVIDASKMANPLDVRQPGDGHSGRPREGRLTLRSLTHQMLQATAQGLLAAQLHTMEIIVWWPGNLLPHLIPVILAIVLGATASSSAQQGQSERGHNYEGTPRVDVWVELRRGLTAHKNAHQANCFMCLIYFLNAKNEHVIQ